MKILWCLLAKDWLRVIRNPIPWLVLLLLPMAITLIMGAAFGGGASGNNDNSAPLEVVLVNEDGEVLDSFLRQALGNSGDSARLNVEFLPMDSARDQFLENRYNAMVVIPNGFSEALLNGHALPEVRVIKNPAQSVYPHIVEDLVHSALLRLDLLRKPTAPQLQKIINSFEKDSPPDAITLASVFMKLSESGTHMEKLFLDPQVRVSFPADSDGTDTDIASESESGSGTESNVSRGSNTIFALFLPMMASFFLFFAGDSALREIFREVEMQTLQRFAIRFGSASMIVVSKMVFSFSMVLAVSMILHFGGGAVFGIIWKDPLSLIILCLANAIFVSGAAAFLIAFLVREKRVQLWTNLILFAMAFAGGSILSVSALPDWMQEFVSPWMPNNWFISAMHATQLGRGDYPLWLALVNLSVAGALLIAISLMRLRSLVRNNQLIPNS